MLASLKSDMSTPRLKLGARGKTWMYVCTSVHPSIQRIYMDIDLPTYIHTYGCLPTYGYLPPHLPTYLPTYLWLPTYLRLPTSRSKAFKMDWISVRLEGSSTHSTKRWRPRIRWREARRGRERHRMNSSNGWTDRGREGEERMNLYLSLSLP